MVSNPYLDEIQNNIRVRPIPWEGYVRANLLSANEAGLVKAVEKASPEKRETTVSQNASVYAMTIVTLLDRITRDDVVKYLLSLTGDFATSVPAFAEALLQDASVTYGALLKLLKKSDEQIYLLSARALVTLCSVHTAEPAVIGELLLFLSNKLASSSNVNLQDIAVQFYGVLLRNKAYRKTFWDNGKTLVPPLIAILESNRGGIQLQYYALLALWLMTFEKEPAKVIPLDYGLISLLLDTSKRSPKEKIVRISLAILVNCVNLAPQSSIPILVSSGALPLVTTLSDRKWADEELIEDLSFLKTRLQEAIDSMSTFDEYYAELVSKRLQWTPAHRSENFWKSNIEKFKEHDWKILKQLAHIIADSQDAVVLAVGCSDVSYIINELPESARILEKLGTKVRVMSLMSSSDPEVRFEALKATQAFITHSFK